MGLLALILVDVVQLSIPRVIKRVVDDLTQLKASGGSLMVQAALIAAMALSIGLFR